MAAIPPPLNRSSEANRRMPSSWSGAITVLSAPRIASCAISLPTNGSAMAMLKIMIGPIANIV